MCSLRTTEQHKKGSNCQEAECIIQKKINDRGIGRERSFRGWDHGFELYPKDAIQVGFAVPLSKILNCIQ